MKLTKMIEFLEENNIEYTINANVYMSTVTIVLVDTVLEYNMYSEDRV